VATCVEVEASTSPITSNCPPSPLPRRASKPSGTTNTASTSPASIPFSALSRSGKLFQVAPTLLEISARTSEVRGESLATIPRAGSNEPPAPNADPNTTLKINARTSGARKAMINTDLSLTRSFKSLAAMVKTFFMRLPGSYSSRRALPVR